MTAEDLLNELGLQFMRAGAHHHVSAGWLGLDCPRCSPGSGRYRLGLNAFGRYLHCWVCGPLPLLSTLAELSGKPPTSVRNAIGSLVRPAQAEKRPRGSLTLPHATGPLLTQHKAYLRGRGLDVAAVTEVWDLRGTNYRGDPPWHVVVPITHKGEVVSWTARSIAPHARVRYHNARPDQEAVPAKSLLYGADGAGHAVIVTEGPADCWAIGPGAVSVMGVSYSREQLANLARYPVRWVCFDAEDDAQRRARRLCEDLAALPGQTHNVLLESGKDAGEASERELKQLRRLLR